VRTTDNEWATDLQCPTLTPSITHVLSFTPLSYIQTVWWADSPLHNVGDGHNKLLQISGWSINKDSSLLLLFQVGTVGGEGRLVVPADLHWSLSVARVPSDPSDCLEATTATRYWQQS
jgi:hypothetical protein